MQKINKMSITHLKKFTLPLTLIFLFPSCSSSKLVSPSNDYENNINKINYLGSSNSSKIYLSDESIFYCSYLNISKDSVNFIDDTDSTHQISINQLEKVFVKDNASSLLSAFWIGLGSGILVTVAASQINDCGTYHPNIGPLYIGGAAIPVGFMFGYNFTGEKEYIFDHTK